MSINNKKVLAVTLARGGSKSIPNKNIVELAGRPLIEYTFDEANLSEYIDYYCVSTDNNDIIEVCKRNKIEYVTRPSHLASDTAKSSDALLHAVEQVDGNFDYIVELMATNPFKSVEDIDACIELLSKEEDETVVSVVQIFDHHPSRVKYIKNGKLMNFYSEQPESRRQDLVPKAYVRNGSIYAMTVNFLKDTKSRYKEGSLAYIMPQKRTVNIDEPIDLLVAKAKLGLSN